MGMVKLPSQIYGEWIWKQSLADRPDSYLLMRKEFVCSSVGLETNLWISANCNYLLFVNGRFAGFGPRAHQNCGTSYIDQHDITYYLESGINVIAVQVYYTSDPESRNRRVPGLWCQVESSGQEILRSDRSWFIHDGGSCCGNRPRISPGLGMTQYLNAELMPKNWINQMFLPDSTWTHPDWSKPVGEFGARLELHPLPPPSINDEHPAFTVEEHGKVVGEPNWTQVLFKRAAGESGETYAAATYLFCEEAQELPVKLFTDDPFKLFCNNRLAADAACRCGEDDLLLLEPGWNRLLLIQNPSRHSMGFLIIFPDTEFGRELRIYQDMVDTTAPAWSTVGPLKLTLAEATPSLNFTRLQVTSYLPHLGDLTDPASVLKSFRFESDPSPAKSLGSCDYVLFRLDTLRYGFARLTIDASAGDIVDITLGMRRNSRGFISSGEQVKGTGTLICRAGRNDYLTCIPGDCFYVMVSVRKASRRITVDNIIFEELYRLERRECTFSSSDALLNRFWEVGRQTLRRSAAFVPLSESRPDHDCYMLDAYIDAVNMAAVFGDFDYMTARLRQFIDAQLENGDIPALTYGVRHASQIHHLFFLPIWIFYNYRFSANRVELERSVSALDLTREYFEAMLDEETGLLVDVETRFGLHSRLSYGEFQEGDIPTYLNAMFCRFLLSAADVYRVVELPDSAYHCIRLAQKIAQQLTAYNYDPEVELFSRWPLSQKREPDHNLFANFCAMFGGVLSLESFEHFFYSFFNYDPPFDRSSESQHPYFHFLFMEMLFAIGQRDWAFRYFRDYWERRLCDESGAWRISLDSKDPAPTKFSDGSCVSPNIFLLREVLGIRIAEAGHTVIYFNPALNLVDWAEGTLTMARGRLKVKWEKLDDGSLDVTLDSNVPVKILPEMSHRLISNTTFRLGEQVTLLNPPAELVEDDEVEAEE